MRAFTVIASLVLLTFSSCTVKKASNDARMHPYDSANNNQTHIAVKETEKGHRTSPQSAPQTPVTTQKPALSMEEERFSSLADMKNSMKKEAKRSEVYAAPAARRSITAKCKTRSSAAAQCYAPAPPPEVTYYTSDDFNTEQYNPICENGFKKVTDDPLSTFSIDVDVASYSNIRRFLTGNTLPPKDAVRIEEMINYFTYDYPQPKGNHPFSITAEVGSCPWETKHQLVHIGLQGKKVATESLPASNLVFLLDVSGSMNSYDKLPLLKEALKLLVNQLRSQDRVAITVYAGSAGLVLPSTPGNRKNTIIEALDRLSAGGSTAGGAGIQLAYETAKQHFIPNGNNRVILATDGDFNVGPSSDAELVRLIEQKRKNGIYLTVLGFGTGNYKDSKMEQLADKGNGNYAYIDNLLEAKKVLVNEMGGTLLTIAKDVKIQIEFNPEHVSAYRLVGYENRILAHQDFNDDTKDAGELGAGHTVTALYEIIPTGVKSALPSIDPLKYQPNKNIPTHQTFKEELLTVKFRYKKPDEEKSKLIVKTLGTATDQTISDNFRFSAAVASFGMLLRDSKYKGNLTYERVIKLARTSKGYDLNGYRSECIKLMEQAELLSSKLSYLNN